MKLKWYGHACFELESNESVKIVTDPYDPKIGYNMTDTKADIVTVSHNHYDHNDLSIINNGYTLISDLGKYNIRGITIDGIHSFHDEKDGELRGKNIIYKYYIDNYIICHLGDLGHKLNNDQLDALKNIDVLLIPVGGTYTLDSKLANEVVKQISPQIVIPMHYKTNKLTFELDTVDNFLKYFKNIEKIESNELEITDKLLEGNKKVFVLNYE